MSDRLGEPPIGYGAPLRGDVEEGAGRDGPGRWGRLRRRIALILLVALVFVVFLAPYMIVNVPVGSGGVLWRRFGGTELRFSIPSGVTIKWPWDIVYIYDLRLQARNVDIVAITSDGLNISISITYRWFLNQKFLPHLNSVLGPSYAETLLLPEVNAATRREFAMFAVRDYYGPTRENMMQRVYRAVVDPGVRNYICSQQDVAVENANGNWQDCLIILTDVLVRDVALPPRIVAAIQSKIEQEQLVQEMQYRVEREHFESDRKYIEAEGIRKFQETVQSGISENYLKWRGIEATVLLATSPNAKTVVVGGNNGLPLILNTGDSATPSPPPQQQTQGQAPGLGLGAIGAVGARHSAAATADYNRPAPSAALSGSLDVSRPDLGQRPPGGSGAILPQGAWSSDLSAYTRAYENGLLPQSIAPLVRQEATDAALATGRPVPAAPPPTGQQGGPPQLRPGAVLPGAVPPGTPSLTSGERPDPVVQPHAAQLVNSPLGLGGARDLFATWAAWFSPKEPPPAGQGRAP
ncbi:SPFH domain-containing protein [Xanthobacter sp. VTT E-85241]|uniref:prohibitin family protein n=1 Tax=Roseixanthobacter finlandensis TaxID=3119922 RepID=UPI0037284846